MPTNETAAQRFSRDWVEQKGTRILRGLGRKKAERWTREYVNAATGQSAASSLITSVLAYASSISSIYLR